MFDPDSLTRISISISSNSIALAVLSFRFFEMEAGPSRKRRKGGIQQRLAQEQAERVVQSQVHAVLMANLAGGVVSSVLCHQIAQAAATDIAKPETAMNFLTLINWLASNMERTCQQQ